MKKIIYTLMAFAFYANCHSQTNVGGSIIANTQWSLSGSPYTVVSDIVLFPDYTLTIDPGVVVKFNDGTGMELRGKLIAIGTAADSIVFTSNSNNPVKGSWKGIKCVATTNPIGFGNQVTMQYVKGMYADRFIDLDLAYHGPYIFKNCYFANNNKVNHDGGSPTTKFDHCTFEYNSLGLEYCQFGGRASHCKFLNNINAVDGFEIIDTCYFSGNTGIALVPYGVTTGCTIQNNNIGVSAMFNSVNHSFVRNIVANNDIGVEIKSYFNGSITFTGNAICNNTTYNIRHIAVNNANLSNNCWCTTNPNSIQPKIYDGYINNAYGLVNFLPLANDCSIYTSLSESVDDQSMVKILPNPASDKLIINAKETRTGVVIMNITGSIIYDLEVDHELKTVDLQHLPNGIYFVRAGNRTEKLIKN